MADIAKTGTPSLASQLPPQALTIVGLVAGEDLAAFDACYIKSDGKVWRAIGTAVNAAAKVRGYAPRAIKAGEAITLYMDVNVRYAAALTPGADVFLGAAAGAIADAATTGGTAPIGYVVDAQRVRLFTSRY